MKLHEMKRENDKDMTHDSTENNDAFDWFNFDCGRKTRVEEFKNLGNTFHTLILQTNCLFFISAWEILPAEVQNLADKKTILTIHTFDSVIKETQRAGCKKVWCCTWYSVWNFIDEIFIWAQSRDNLTGVRIEIFDVTGESWAVMMMMIWLCGSEVWWRAGLVLAGHGEHQHRGHWQDCVEFWEHGEELTRVEIMRDE